jgi:adenosylmethionine-8-amino-7-oxononanoate aminotransferase
MATKKIQGVPYHLWNPYTPMDKYLSYLDFGPTYITHGEGLYAVNQRGKRFLICNSATWNFALGYGREEIIEAACKQMEELAFSNCWGMSHPRAVELAAKLVEITGNHYTHVYLGANGTEAVEAALKLARQYHRQSPEPADHGRFKIISLRYSYHGYSYGAVSAAGRDDYNERYGPMLPGYIQIEPPYCYRCPYQEEGYPDCGLACASALEEIIEKEGPETIAGFIMEPIMGEHGVIDPPDEYFSRVGEICHRYGLLWIVDEVTTGFGRTGKLFVSQDWNPQPDVLCLGKVISGGYLPLSAMLATEAVFQRFLGKDKYLMHGSTNSGHPVSAAVGLAAIDIILKENLVENAAQVGAYLKSELEKLMSTHPLFGDVRGRGLMLAVELVKDRQTKQPLTEDETFNYILDIVDRGILISLGGLVLFPPLTINQKIADQIVEAFDQSLRTGIMPDLSRKFRLVKEFARTKL